MNTVSKNVLVFSTLLSLIGCASFNASVEMQEKANLAGKIGCPVDNVFIDHNTEKSYDDTLHIQSVQTVNVMCGKKRYLCSHSSPGLTTSILGTQRQIDSYRTEMTCSPVS